MRADSRRAKLVLIAASAALLTLALAPFNQFYLAWIALAPWILAIARARSGGAAWRWGFVGGAIFFLANFLYLARVTVPGAIALSLYLALYWAFAAWALHPTGLLTTAPGCTPDLRGLLLRSAAVAAIWTAFEWLRGTLLTGLPFLYVGHTQSPFLAMCQIADLTGAYGISFLIVLVNALIALALLHRPPRRQLLGAAAASALLLSMVLGYGVFRLAQSPAPAGAGPRVMVVQPNDPMTRGGKSKSQEDSLRFHLTETRRALAADRAVDLVVWNETTLPPLNAEARSEPGLAGAAFLNQVHDALSELTRRNDVSLVAGGYYVGGWRGQPGHRRATDIRNAAFLYDRTGQQAGRYDKIHLVPFGEFIPFRVSLPWFFQLFLWLGPHSQEYAISSADPDALTVFVIRSGTASAAANSTPNFAPNSRAASSATPSSAPTSSATASSAISAAAPAAMSWRFVTPICYEDLDAPLVRRMIHSSAGGKRADFIVNVTNDGWFRWNQMSQHLQASVFRTIENRVPLARAVNTGISGFVDSSGRTHDLIPAGREGVRTATLTLDPRVTVYSRIGDAFAIACALLAATLVAQALWLRRRMRRSRADIC